MTYRVIIKASFISIVREFNNACDALTLMDYMTEAHTEDGEVKVKMEMVKEDSKEEAPTEPTP